MLLNKNKKKLKNYKSITFNLILQIDITKGVT